ncbi:hypothetical protein DYB25_005208 [Aphanomyces astaci]|uniref:N-acetyltransferase domain-containing protein n=1 Tax=Aphanomyces astaci TaxID=112090 RepID=A0A397BMI2_APHAT|nr:hypothetical protein DYB25_005208 [Aphanomyces astaci]RHZ02876.1 hypothetical protein DYB26_007232 [Aphanomyces astaci]
MLLTVLIDDGAFGVDAMPSGWGAILPHCVTLRRKKPLYTSAEGGVALYKSLTPFIARALDAQYTIVRASIFGSFAKFKELLGDTPGTKSSSRANVSAGVLESMLIVTPFDMIKTRLQMDGSGQGAVVKGPGREVFAPLLSLLGVPPASSAMPMSAPPTTQSRIKTTNTPVHRFHEDGLRVLTIPPARRRRRKPTDDAVYTPMETTMPQHPDVLFHPSSCGLSLKAASSHTTFGSQSDTESASDFRAASAPCDAVVRVCLICDCTAKKHKQHQQLFLDLGQKDIGERTCSACGLLYMHGVESDDRAHAQYCKKLGQGIVISGWRSERVHRTLDTKAARIIEIRGDDSSAHVKKLLQIKSLLDDALGLVDEGAFLKQKHFVYLHQNRVVGVVSAEDVATGYELDSSSEIVSIDPSSQGHKVMVGVSHVWVHPSFRRQQIARALVDVMRQGFSYGMTIPTSKVAFSQPTNDGRLFAAQYCAPHPLLIYSS